MSALTADSVLRREEGSKLPWRGRRHTKETTMWRCWVGFNASHSMGLILFGLAFGYLALAHD